MTIKTGEALNGKTPRTTFRNFMLTPLLTVPLIIVPQTALALLNEVPGLNEVQFATATAVQTVCGNFIADPASRPVGSQEEQLFTRCGEMVHSSNDLLDNGGPTTLSLGLSAEELGEAIQRIAPEETEIMGAGATDTSQDQLANIGNRMQSLRNGTRISSSSGISWDLDGQTGGAAGSDAFSRTGLFVNGLYGDGKRDASAEQDGFDYEAYGLTFGLDHRYANDFVAGVALGFTHSDVDINNNFGDYDTDGYSLSVYGTWYTQYCYLEGMLSYGSYSYEGARVVEYSTIDQTLNLDTDGDQIAYSLAAGYNHGYQAFNSHFFGRLEGIEADIDAYNESGTELAMHVDSQSIDSLQSIIGAQLSYSASLDSGVLVPYFGWAQHHEFDDEKRSISARYIFDPTNTSFSFNTEAADQNFSVVSLGSSLVLKGGNQFFINLDKVLNLENVVSRSITAGIRIEL